ncbi:Nucleoside diphosphate kinase 7 [Kappamyces sp. JEL0680]|nr:Nucleoside diphosphate kinase 7 [Kappamyces sp. JEL0680]
MESTLLVVGPSGLPHLGTILTALSRTKFVLCHLRLARLDGPNRLSNSSLLSAAEKAVFAGGSSAIIEVLRKDAVREMQDLVRTGFKSHLPGGGPASGMFYCPSTLEDAQTALAALFENGPSLPRTATLNNCTLCIVRPHAIIDGHHGAIIQDIINAGYSITDADFLHLDKNNAEEFLEVYKGVAPEYHLYSGPLIAMELTGGPGASVVQSFREFVGPSDPALAKVIRPHSLRAKYGEDKVKNAVHCTDLPDDSVLEAEYFFKLL